MKRLLIAFLVFAHVVIGQPEQKFIKEENVSRVIKTLTADEMMGRSASKPEDIDKAAAFIAFEFNSIGLKPMQGLTGFRQEFKKDMIVPQTLEVTINGQKIPTENALLVSEITDLNFTGGPGVIVIPCDTTIKNTRQFLLSKAFNLTRDTSTAFVLVAPEFKENFKELKSYFGKRFVSGRKTNKLFVLGVTSVLSYSVKATQKIEPITMANVVGVLPGKTKPDEFVVCSGHYDHIGIRPAVAGDSIANGADDDASGTTAVIELAGYLKNVKNNQRTLIFVAFTAEEIGGFGSKYFSEQLATATAWPRSPLKVEAPRPPCSSAARSAGCTRPTRGYRGTRASSSASPTTGRTRRSRRGTSTTSSSSASCARGFSARSRSRASDRRPR